MKWPTFYSGVAVAMLLALTAGLGFNLAMPVIGLDSFNRIAIPALALVYIGYLFGNNQERAGRVTILLGWTVLTIITWVIELPLLFHVLVHMTAIWLIRCLYYYSSFTSVFIDICLNILSILLAIWAIKQTGSVFISVWCFFLVQALFVMIPSMSKAKSIARQSLDNNGKQFEQARKRAEQAIRQLFAR